jgi:hypothetical protein
LPTGTATYTPTVAWGGTFTITETVIYPNPYIAAEEDLKIIVALSRPAAELKVRVYTVSYRRVLEIDAGSASTREAMLTISQWKLGRLAAGTYYVVVTGKSDLGGRAASKPVVLTILK